MSCLPEPYAPTLIFPKIVYPCHWMARDATETSVGFYKQALGINQVPSPVLYIAGIQPSRWAEPASLTLAPIPTSMHRLSPAAMIPLLGKRGTSEFPGGGLYHGWPRVSDHSTPYHSLTPH